VNTHKEENGTMAAEKRVSAEQAGTRHQTTATNLLAGDRIRLDGADWEVRHVRPLDPDTVVIDLNGVHIRLARDRLIERLRPFDWGWESWTASGSSRHD
jgi:hypothetical protein